MKKKNIIAMILGTFIFMFLTITNVNAEVVREVIISGESYQIFQGQIHKNNIIVESLPEGISWDNDTSTFILNNYTGTSIITKTTGLELNVHLIGTNNLTCSSYYGYSGNQFSTVTTLYASYGDINITGEDDAVLNINCNSNLKTEIIKSENAGASSNIAKVYHDGGTININATTTDKFIAGVQANALTVNNNANLNINAKSTSNEIETAYGVYAKQTIINTTGNVSISSNNSAISENFNQNSKGMVYLSGETGPAIVGEITYAQYGLNYIPAEYTIYGAPKKNSYKSKYGISIIEEPISINNIVLAPPVGAENTQKFIETDQFSGYVNWGNGVEFFDENTVYTAEITIVPKLGYKYEGLPSDFFKVNGETASFSNGVVSKTFPPSSESIKTTINNEIDLPAPVAGEDVLGTLSNDEYTATVKYYLNGTDYELKDIYLYDTTIKAVVEITPKEGYTTVGIPANSYTVKNMTAEDVTITNEKSSKVVTIVYNNPTTAGNIINIGSEKYKIDESDPSSYSNLPEGISWDTVNHRLVLTNYTGTAIYTPYEYNHLNIALVGKNTLTGIYDSAFDYQVFGLGANKGLINLEGTNGATLNINIDANSNSDWSNKSVAAIFSKRSAYYSNYNVFNNVILNINITGDYSTRGIYLTDIDIKGTSRVSIIMDSNYQYSKGFSDTVRMNTTGKLYAKMVNKGLTGTVDSRYYSLMTYTQNIDSVNNKYYELAYKATNNITLNSMSNGTASLDKSSANTFDIVTIEDIAPDIHYGLDSIKIYDEYNNDITNQVEYNSETHSFKMPPNPVTVEVNFEQTEFLHDITSISASGGSYSAPSSAYSTKTVAITNITPIEKYKLSTIKILRSSDGTDVTEDVGYNNETNTFTMPNYPVKVEATFVPINYQINNLTSTNGTITVPNSAAYESTVDITVNPASHYELDTITITKVSDDSDVTEEANYNNETHSFEMPNYDINILATFKAINYSITNEAVDHGSIAVPISATYNETVSIFDITPDDYYILTEVQILKASDNADVTTDVNYNNTNNTFTMPDYAIIVKPKFELVNYEIINQTVSNGTITIDESATYGSTVNISASPDEYYELTKIQILKASDDTDVTTAVNYNSTTNTFTMPDYAVIVKPKFELINYSITNQITSNGTINIDETATYGSTVNISASPDANYEVDRITITTSSTGTDITDNVSLNQEEMTFTMPGCDINILVTFKPVEYQITKVIEGQGNVTVPTTASYGSTVEITNITPNENYDFVKIQILKSSDNTDVTTAVNYNAETNTFNMPSYSIKVVVEFKAKEVATAPVLTVNTYNYTSLKLTWNKLDTAQGYKIYRATSKTGTYYYYKNITSNATTSYINTGLTTGKTYYYKIRGYNANGNGPISTLKGNTVRPAKANLSVAYTGYSSIKISWNKIYGINYYNVYRSTDGKSYSLLKTIKSGTTYYTNTSLTTNKKYYYKVSSYRIVSGKKVYSYSSNIVSSTPYLKNTTATGYDSYYRYARVNFTKVSGATGYKIYRATSEDGGYYYQGKTTNTYYLDYNVAEGKTYYYKVRPYRTVNKVTKYGTYSNKTSAVRANDTISFSLKSTQANNVVITINRHDTARYYYIYRATSQYGTYSHIKTIAQNKTSELYSYTDSGRSFNKVYYYKIKIYNKNTSDYSVVKAKRTELGVPGLSIVDGSFLETVITITPGASYATGYEIYRSRTLDGTYSLLKRTTSRTYKYELTSDQYRENKTYFYKVRAYKIVSGKTYYGKYSTPQEFTLEEQV